MSVPPAQAKIGIVLGDQGGRLAGALDLAGLAGQLARVKAVALVLTQSGPLAEAAEAAQAALQAGQVDRLLWLGRLSPEQRAWLTGELGQAGLNRFLLDFLDPAAQGALGPDLPPAWRIKKTLVLAKVAAARLRLAQPLAPSRLPAVDRAVVIGAGVAGLHAAATLAKLGHAVTLVERRSGVGGKTALLARFYPLSCDPACGLYHVLEEIPAGGRVEVRTLAEVVGLAGRPGSFEVRLRRAPRYVDESRCTACGACAAVCPVNLPAERLAVQDEEPVWPTAAGLLALHGRTVKAIHPAEPLACPVAWVVERERCPPGCQLCQAACPHQAVDLDMASVEERVQAGFVLAAPGWDPYPLSRLHDYGYARLKRVIGNLELERLLVDAPAFDWSGVKSVGFVQCAGSREADHLAYCSTVCCSATIKQIKRIKELNPAAGCYVFYQDLRCPGFEEDLLKEVAGLPEVIFIRGNPAEVGAADPDGPVTVLAEDAALGRKVKLTLDLVVLAGGLAPARGAAELAQVLGLPLNRYGFFEAHLQCHPEESQRTGVYVGGSARQPMGVAAAIDSAHRALAEGLRFLGGEIEIPPTHPVVDPGKCDKCKRCVEDCPFQAYGLDEAGFPRPDLAKCRHCGNCLGVCPLGAITLRHLSLQQLTAQVEVLAEAAPALGQEPLILGFFCGHDAALAARRAAEEGLALPPNLVWLELPCAGAVNNALVAEAISQGIDGVLIAGCHAGQCHALRGEALVAKRSGDLADKLRQMRLEPERVRFIPVGVGQAARLAELAQAYAAELKALGPNPFRL